MSLSLSGTGLLTYTYILLTHIPIYLQYLWTCLPVNLNIHTYSYHLYIHTHLYLPIHTNIHTYTHIYLPIHTSIYLYIHTYFHTYIHTYIHKVFNPNRTSILSDLQSLKYTYTHTYIHTYLHLQSRISALTESNPMLGFRGCRLSVVYPEITEMQTRAIFGSNTHTLFTLPSMYVYVCMCRGCSGLHEGRHHCESADHDSPGVQRPWSVLHSAHHTQRIRTRMRAVLLGIRRPGGCYNTRIL